MAAVQLPHGNVSFVELRQKGVRLLHQPSLAVHLLRGEWYLRNTTMPHLTSRVVGRVRVRREHDATISLGRGCVMMGTVASVELAATAGATIEIGTGTFINYGTSIAARERVTIGRNCHIGQLCVITDNDHHDIENKYLLPPSSPIVLGDRVWIGALVVILKGVTIGDDSVVAAGSVVTHDVPPRTVVAGVPAKVLKQF